MALATWYCFAEKGGEIIFGFWIICDLVFFVVYSLYTCVGSLIILKNHGYNKIVEKTKSIDQDATKDITVAEVINVTPSEMAGMQTRTPVSEVKVAKEGEEEEKEKEEKDDLSIVD